MAGEKGSPIGLKILVLIDEDSIVFDVRLLPGAEVGVVLLKSLYVVVGAEKLELVMFGPAGRSWLRAGLVAVAAWLLVPVSSFALCLAVMADIQKSLWEVVPLLPYGVVAPVALVAVTYLVN